MPLSYADIFQHNTSSQAQGYLFLQHVDKFRGGEQKLLPKRWKEDSFTGEPFCS